MPYSTRNIEFIAYTVWREVYLKEWGRKLATKIMRLDAAGLFFVGLCEKQSLRKQSPNHSTIETRNYTNNL
jgi:hypothetical protein